MSKQQEAALDLLNRLKRANKKARETMAINNGYTSFSDAKLQLETVIAGKRRKTPPPREEKEKDQKNEPRETHRPITGNGISDKISEGKTGKKQEQTKKNQGRNKLLVRFFHFFVLKRPLSTSSGYILLLR